MLVGCVLHGFFFRVNVMPSMFTEDQQFIEKLFSGFGSDFKCFSDDFITEIIP